MRQVRILEVLVPVLLLVIVGFGVWLRVQEPASSPVIGAEDPYTHLVFTKEALARGWFGDSQWLGTAMYPPGLHALGGALATDSGTSLYAWTLWSPIAFGALAIVGMYALGARLGGPVAGLVAAFLVAIMPEHVFRTELYFPTALDLAILPAYMLAFVLANGAEASSGQRAGAAVLFAILTAALAFTHPWAVPLFLVPCALWLALRVLRAGQPFDIGARRLAWGAGMAVLGVSFAFASRWDHTESGFATFLDHLGPFAALARLSLPAPTLFVVFVLALGTLAIPCVLVGAYLGAARPRVHPAFRFGVAAIVALACLAAAWTLGRGRLPQDVSYVYMLGELAIVLALGGLVAACLRPTSVGDLALATSVVLFPLTALDVFGSPFWPQRTVVYLGLGVALLGATLVVALHDALLDLRPLRAPATRRWVAPVALLAAVLLVAGAAQAAPQHAYSWYRLYTDQEFGAIQKTADMLESTPGSHVIVYSWQAPLFLKALGMDNEKAQYCPKCFRDGGVRASTLSNLHGPVYVIGDKYLDKDVAKGKADASWLDGAKVVLSAGNWRVYQVGG